MSSNKQSATKKDFSGQIKTVQVLTPDHGIKTIPSDRTGAALRKVLPPTAKSECSDRKRK
jgi:hypothetical protein